ncbi:MAG: DUF4976 domain-containing protein [Armatimonadetes bacterium]|nr:DUF4976 domain-containing protein [Armatimonadota bacterium]
MRRSPGTGLFLLAGALLLCAAGSTAGTRTPRRPNILLIYADDQSYKTIGCYPEALPGVQTPHIDALARRGIRFHGAFLGAWCTPSRASMLTGRHPHGIESLRPTDPYPSGTYDPEKTPFWPRVFRQNGYVTAQIGKWHTGVDAGTGRDWDWQIVWNRPKHPANAGNYYTNQILSFNGVERTEPGYSTDNYTRWASEFIRGQHRDPNKPWYLWLCYGAVHGPTTPAPRHVGLHKSDPVRVPADILPPRPGKPEYLNRTQAWHRGPDGQLIAGASGERVGDAAGRNRATYAAFVHQTKECNRALDEGVGAVLAALKESGQWENTLVIYTADQGFGMGEHGFRSKLAPYDATYRSPLLVSQPGTIPEGKSVPHCASAPDLVTTLFAWAGIRQPWKMHGRDLSPVLRNPETRWNHPVFYSFTGDRFGSDTVETMTNRPGEAAYHEVPWYIAQRDRRWKYVRYVTPGETEELYDLEKDPEELHNLADDPGHRDTLRELRARAVTQFKRYDGPGDRLAPTRRSRENL